MADDGTDLGWYLAQRISALVMAPLVLLHLGTLIYAVQGGLDAAEILARTRGSVFWGGVYGVFVVAVSVHAAVGIRVIAREWGRFGRRRLDLISLLVCLGLLLPGGQAVVAIVGG